MLVFQQELEIDISFNVDIPDLSQADTVEKVSHSRKTITELMERLSPQKYLVPAEDNGWTFKDILFHLVVWEKRMIRWIGMLQKGEVPEIRDPNFTLADLDRLNQITYDEHKDVPLYKALQGFLDLESQVLESVKRIEPHQYNKEYFDIIAANTFLHYDEHKPAILRIVKGKCE